MSPCVLIFLDWFYAHECLVMAVYVSFLSCVCAYICMYTCALHSYECETDREIWCLYTTHIFFVLLTYGINFSVWWWFWYICTAKSVSPLRHRGRGWGWLCWDHSIRLFLCNDTGQWQTQVQVWLYLQQWQLEFFCEVDNGWSFSKFHQFWFYPLLIIMWLAWFWCDTWQIGIYLSLECFFGLYSYNIPNMCDIHGVCTIFWCIWWSII